MNRLASILPAAQVLVSVEATSKKRAFEEVGLLFETQHGLSRALITASLFARESGGGITLVASADKSLLSLHSIASELGENTSEASADITTGGEVTINSRYLSEVLNVIQADDLEFSFNGKLAPCILVEKTKQPDYLYIIMPMKS